MTVYLGIPLNQNIQQFTNVQRGTIFMWMISIVVITVMVVIRVIMGEMQKRRQAYEDSNTKQKSSPTKQKEQNFFHTIINAQKPIQDDPGSVVMVKKADKFNTLLLPIIITFALNFTLGATYPFSLVLFFIVISFVFLFNLCELHKKLFDHKVFIVFFDNIWLMASFFWFVNIWVTVNYPQPYYLLEV